MRVVLCCLVGGVVFHLRRLSTTFADKRVWENELFVIFIFFLTFFMIIEFKFPDQKEKEKFKHLDGFWFNLNMAVNTEKMNT